ncbi:hypothetical protein E4U33_001403, partial [Claviceps sp. LM78 group G4]
SLPPEATRFKISQGSGKTKSSGLCQSSTEGTQHQLESRQATGNRRGLRQQIERSVQGRLPQEGRAAQDLAPTAWL